MRLYLDASYIIYLVESGSPWHEAAVRRFSDHRSQDGQVVTSQLSRLECRVKPLRERDRMLAFTSARITYVKCEVAREAGTALPAGCPASAGQ